MTVYLSFGRKATLFTINVLLDIDQKFYRHSIRVYFPLSIVQLKFGQMGHDDVKVV
jgi:hypothetical protein